MTAAFFLKGDFFGKKLEATPNIKKPKKKK
jgi:hypothetical protein